MTSKYSVELFMEACGAGGPLHLSLQDANRSGPLRKVFHQPFVVIGRNPTSDLLLDHWQVSRRHAYLQLVQGRLFCLDLGSRTGIVWDDGTKESDWLDPARSLVVGPYEISIWADGGIEPPPPQAMDEASKATQGADESGTGSYAIEFMNSSSRSPIQLSQSLALVGSSLECKVRLPHSDVSKAHCGLIKSPQGVWVVDLLGRGGTFVNETHVRFARLDEGDELRIGRHVLRFEHDGSKSRETRNQAPSRALMRRHDTDAIPARIDRHQSLPTPTSPSSSVSMTSPWQYPEYEVHRAVNAHSSNQADLIQALMQPMVQQFGMMQQQMFEQFHQAMMGMFQTFGAAYREQMTDLREELDEVRRITQELQELQRLSQATAAANQPAVAPPAPPPVPLAAPPPRVKSRGTEEPVAPRPQTAEPQESKLKTPPTKSDMGVHNVLFERISSLQNERQTRWQKILSKLNKA